MDATRGQWCIRSATGLALLALLVFVVAFDGFRADLALSTYLRAFLPALLVVALLGESQSWAQRRGARLSVAVDGAAAATGVVLIGWVLWTERPWGPDRLFFAPFFGAWLALVTQSVVASWWLAERAFGEPKG